MKYIISIFFFSLFFVSFLAAQEIAMRHFTVNNGLPSNTVYRILEDEMGYIWMATENGIVKYNGKEFKVIKNENIESNDFIFVSEVGNHFFCLNANYDFYSIRNDSIEIIKYDKAIGQISKVFVCNEERYVVSAKGVFEYEVENDSLLVISDYLVEENYGVSCVDDSFLISKKGREERLSKSLYLEKDGNRILLGDLGLGNYNAYRDGFQGVTYNKTLFPIR